MFGHGLQLLRSERNRGGPTSKVVRVARDVGGTFTDLVYFETDLASGTQTVRTEKADATPPDFERGMLAVLDKAGVRIAETDFLAHGSTVVINAPIKRKGARTALITTRGFRDVLDIARGNEEAAILSGVRTKLVKVAVFGLNGFAAGLAGTIGVLRVSMGQPQAGAGMELDAIAAVILGGTSIYGGSGAVWRSVAGVLLLALIDNGFNVLNVNPSSNSSPRDSSS